jgi:cation transport regulator ChaC
VWVLAYGSLLLRAGVDATGVAVTLHEHRRRWNVAMENTRDLPGYRFFRDPRTGERPDVAVAFVNACSAPGGQLNAVAFAVAPDDLPALDARERNYERVDVSALVEPALDAPVHAYLGLPEARERFETAREQGRAVVARAYHDAVRAGFAARGADALAAFERTTDPPGVPLADLVSVPLP